MSEIVASKVIVGVMALESIATGAPSDIAIYSWFRNGTDGESVCRLLDLETGTWCSEELSSSEAVRTILTDGRTITPGMVRNLTLDDLDDEDESIDVLYEIVKNHHVTCKCAPCAAWDARQTLV